MNINNAEMLDYMDPSPKEEVRKRLAFAEETSRKFAHLYPEGSGEWQISLDALTAQEAEEVKNLIEWSIFVPRFDSPDQYPGVAIYVMVTITEPFGMEAYVGRDWQGDHGLYWPYPEPQN